MTFVKKQNDFTAGGQRRHKVTGTSPDVNSVNKDHLQHRKMLDPYPDQKRIARRARPIDFLYLWIELAMQLDKVIDVSAGGKCRDIGFC